MLSDLIERLLAALRDNWKSLLAMVVAYLAGELRPELVETIRQVLEVILGAL